MSSRSYKLLKTKRAIRILFNDGHALELQIRSMVHVNTKLKSIGINELKNGDYCLAVSPDLIPDFTKVDRLEIIREDG